MAIECMMSEGRAGSSGHRMARRRNRHVPEPEALILTIIISEQSVTLLQKLLAHGIYGRTEAEVAARLVDQGLQEFIDRPRFKIRHGRKPAKEAARRP